jgi:D-tyrosyl-tRNA(Tyr) deacylase
VKALLQRVTEARVDVAGETLGSVGPGLLVLVGVEPDDTAALAARLAERTATLRIFPDAAWPEDGKPMNRSVLDAGGGILAVSQFTLAADTSRGRRPGFSTAAPPEVAEPLFDAYVDALRTHTDAVATGRFGADMQVHLVNDGPVTLLLEARTD